MTWGIFKSDAVSEAYKKMKTEELKGNQTKLDKNKNGKLDSDDFKKLRNEDYDDETAVKKSDVPAYLRKDDKLTLKDLDKERTKNKSHPETLAKNNGTTQKEEVQTEGWDDMLKYVKDKNGPQPNGGAGKKQGTRYGGQKQKEDESDKRKEKNEELDVFSDTEIDMLINEVLSKNASAGEWISDFVKSDNPKFAGKSKEQRKKQALAAYYAAQRNESTDYESFLVLDEAKQGDIVKMGAKEIKHANMKEKQNDQEVMEPHSGTEAKFIDSHVIRVADDPTQGKFDSGTGKVGTATAPKGKGPGSYDAKEKLGNQKTGIKEAIVKTAAGEEIDTAPGEKDSSNQEVKAKKKLSAIRGGNKAAGDYDSHQS